MQRECNWECDCQYLLNATLLNGCEGVGVSYAWECDFECACLWECDCGSVLVYGSAIGIVPVYGMYFNYSLIIKLYSFSLKRPLTFHQGLLVD